MEAEYLGWQMIKYRILEFDPDINSFRYRIEWRFSWWPWWSHARSCDSLLGAQQYVEDQINLIIKRKKKPKLIGTYSAGKNWKPIK